MDIGEIVVGLGALIAVAIVVVTIVASKKNPDYTQFEDEDRPLD